VRSSLMFDLQGVAGTRNWLLDLSNHCILLRSEHLAAVQKMTVKSVSRQKVLKFLNALRLYLRVQGLKAQTFITSRSRLSFRPKRD